MDEADGHEGIGALLSALAGGLTALLALRARAHGRRHGVGFLRAVADLPATLGADARRMRASARRAMADGRDAAQRRRHEVDRMLADLDAEIGNDADD